MSGTTALPPKPPSRRAAQCCPMWRCRCRILARCARHLRILTLCCSFYEGGGAPLREILHPSRYKRIAIVTGSEGGFSVEEAAAAKAAGAVTVSKPAHPAMRDRAPGRADSDDAADGEFGVTTNHSIKERGAPPACG